jgi:hypothetical protein
MVTVCCCCLCTCSSYTVLASRGGIMESFCRVCIVWIRCWFADESLSASLLACLTRPLCFLFDEILCFSLASSDVFHVEVTASMLVLSLQSLFWYKLWTRSAWQTDAFSDHVLRAQSMSESDCLDAVSPRRGYALPARMLFLTPTIWSSCFYSGLWLRRDTVAEPFQQSIITILFVFRGSLKIRKRIAFRLFERRLAI